MLALRKARSSGVVQGAPPMPLIFEEKVGDVQGGEDGGGGGGGEEEGEVMAV